MKEQAMSRSLLLEPKKEILKQNSQNQKIEPNQTTRQLRHTEIQFKCVCDKKDGRHQPNCIYNLV